MNISSNTLFHFTKDIKTLKSILEHNFWSSLSIEENNVLDGAMRKLAIPMVCFCDIPLGNIEKHMNKYGDYAIGLTYKWAKESGINPVWYVNHSSSIRKNIRDIFQINPNCLMSEDDSDHGNRMMYLLCYLKKYSTKTHPIDDSNGKVIHYYDEREWRYVPRLFENRERLYLTGEEDADQERHNQIQELLKQHPLCFQPSDINYIIVRKDSEVLDMKHMLEKIKVDYSVKDKEILVTKILSAQRIKNDF